MPDFALTLARLVTDLELAHVPDVVSARARHLMLDAVGCALASRDQDYAGEFLAAVRDLAGNAPGTRGVIGHATRLPLRDAATINGVLAHGLDYDDTHMAGIIHLTVSVLPALLALGAERDASGREVLAAYIAALEAGARIASVVKGGLHDKGFHPTGVVGIFASALAAGRLLGLDAAALVRAQGIALSMSAGSLQFIEDGSWTKRWHPGWAAQAGITAATLAARSIPAPEAPYEGRYGFYALYLGERERAKADPALATAGLAVGDTVRVERWELENIAVKPYPMCHFVHAATDAAIALHRGGARAADVVAVEARMPAGVMAAVCEPLAAKRRPQSDYDAKFSLPYAVACGLLRGRLGLAELAPAAWRDPQVLALMDRVTCVVDADSTFPRHYSGEVRVRMADGRELAHRESINRGHAERPLTNAEVVEKYAANATLSFGAAHADRVRETVLGIDGLASVRMLEDLLAREP